jgi:hypothetical protein
LGIGGAHELLSSSQPVLNGDDRGLCLVERKDLNRKEISLTRVICVPLPKSSPAKEIVYAEESGAHTDHSVFVLRGGLTRKCEEPPKSPPNAVKRRPESKLGRQSDLL